MSARDDLIEAMARDKWRRYFPGESWDATATPATKAALRAEAANDLDAALAYRDSAGRQLIWGKRAHRRIGDHETLFVACDIEEP